MSTRPAVPACAMLLLVLSAGCSSSEPPPSSEPAGPAMNEAQQVAEDFDRAVKGFLLKLEAKAATGWPAHAPLAGTPPRPTVRVQRITNRSSTHVDVEALRGQLVRRLVDQGVVAVAADVTDVMTGDASEDEEEAYLREVEGGNEAEAPVAFLVTGTIEDDVTMADGERSVKRTVILRLVDLRNRGIFLQEQSISLRGGLR